MADYFLPVQGRGREAESTESPQRDPASASNYSRASSGGTLQTGGTSAALKVSSPAPIEDGDWGDISASQVDLDRLLRSNSSSKSPEVVDGRSKQVSGGSRKQNGAAPTAVSQKGVPPPQGEAQQGVSWRGGFAAAQQPPSSWSVPAQQVRRVADIGSQRPANLPQGSARNSALRCVPPGHGRYQPRFLCHAYLGTHLGFVKSCHGYIDRKRTTIYEQCDI